MLELTERDLPIGIVGGTIVASLVPIGWLLWWFIAGGPIAADGAVSLIGGDAGLHAGDRRDHRRGLRLHGGPDRRVEQSGLGRRHSRRARRRGAAVGCSTATRPDDAQALVAYALFTTAIVFSIATISNDNLQDLKTGQLVGATPWKQQVALIIGVIFGSLVIPPVLDLLNTLVRLPGHAGRRARTRWPAPQAALISSLAKGVLGGDIDWDLIGYGALHRRRGHHHRRSARARPEDAAAAAARRSAWASICRCRSTLLDPGRRVDRLVLRKLGRARQQSRIRQAHGRAAATGLIVGESLFGVPLPGSSRRRGNDAPLSVVGEHFETYAVWIGPLILRRSSRGCTRRTKRAAA